MSQPAKKILRPMSSPPARKPGGVWNQRILIVDDEPGITAGYEEILVSTSADNVVSMARSSRRAQKSETAKAPSGTGGQLENPFQFELTICHSGEVAFNEVQKAMGEGRPFAMGFFDVKLGEGMDGYELFKKVQEIDPKFFAVFVTAYNDRSIDSINQFLGIDRVDHWDYLNKPFTAGEILQKARNFVSLWNLREEKRLHQQDMDEAQRRLLNAERMTSVATVARGVGHEFGNILMQIMGQAEVARSKPPEQMKKALDKILDACTRAGDILDRFKDLSETGEEEAHKKVELLHKILDEAIELLEHQFRSNNVKVCRIKNDRVEAEVNSTGILQAIVNLSINSIHAMNKSGQIDYSIIDDGDMAEIRIRDYGPGIPKDILPKATEPFFTTKGKNGTGLGLAICKEIIEIDHQGQFILRNHETKGLEIVMRIPKRAIEEGQHG